MNTNSNLWHLPSRLFVRQREKFIQFLRSPNNIQNLGLWTSALIAGLVSVGYAVVFRGTEQLFHRVLVEHDARWGLVVSPVLFLLAWYLVRRFAPEAAGSGIPQIMAANEMTYQGSARVQVDKLLSLRTAGIKVVSSLLCLLGGGAIGREGPTLQISTSIFHFFGKRVRRWVPDTSEQTWVVAGAAAGLASAFNTPLGGIVYAIEELGVAHFHRVRTALVSAVIVSGLVAQWMLGSYLYVGFPALQNIEFSFLPAVIVVGFVTGLCGGLFGHLLFFLLELRNQVKGVKGIAAVTVGTGILMCGLYMWTPDASGTGIHLINGFLFKDEKASFLLVCVRFFGTMVSYLSGAAGGIFSPSLAIGGALGSWLMTTFDTQHPNLMVLLGMIGFLTGVTRTPFTAFILVLEMTDRHSAIFPMMLTALVAQGGARLADSRSFYEHVKEKWMVREAPVEAS